MTQPTGQQRVPLSRLQLTHPASLQVFEDYEQAQRTVDYLSDREFPVENVMIVGTDLKQVERVTGRLTSGRVVASGALSGAWMGMFFGSLMWLFVQGGGMATFVTAVVVGAAFGAIWAALAYRLTGGARDFTSVTQVVATRYEVLIEYNLVGDARRLLEEMRRGVPKDAGPLSTHAAAQAPNAGWPGAQAPGQPWAGQQYGAPVPSPHTGPGATPYGGPVAPSAAPVAPKYRTYGEALDAERAAREAGAGAAGGPAATDGRDDSAAEDAHDVPTGSASPVDPRRTDPTRTDPTRIDPAPPNPRD